MMQTRYAILFSCVALVAACESDDIGTRCEPEGDAPSPTEPVAGEETLVEVVALERDGDCESFQCLSHRGYPPYCTRECKYESDKGKACVSDADCKKPDHCFEGRCGEDDCPQGFVCGRVHEMGRNADSLFCLRRENCGSNIDCEDLGNVSCQKLGCVDQRLLENDPNAAPNLVCVDREELSFCACPGGNESCGDAELICDPVDADAWEAGSVEQRSACLRKEP